MAAPTALRVEGLRELQRAAMLAGPATKKAMTQALKETAAFVRDMAIYEAHSKGLYKSGDLISQLQPGVSGNSGFVRDFARHDNYPYPSRIEYENGGQRAFLRPAVEKGAPEIEAKLLSAVESVLEHF